MLETLFESIDSSILTPEVKSDLEKTINEAVEAKAAELLEARVKEKTVELEAKAADFATEQITEAQTIMSEAVEAYLDRAVKTFIAEAKEDMAKSILSEKAELVIESVSASLIAAGVNIAKLELETEIKNDSVVESALVDMTSKYDALVEEVFAKDKEIKELSRLGTLSEVSKGLSLVESKKFMELSAVVDFVDSADYTSKLETIKESIKGSKDVEPEVIVTESAKDSEPAWKRFV